MKNDQSHEDQETCSDVIHHAVEKIPGIVDASLDPKRGEVEFEYDPRLLDDPEIVRVAKQVAPAVRQQLNRCTMKLEGRACEACALKLEKKMLAVDGVRKATATYLGGILSVTYDESAINDAEVMDKAQSVGARVAPLQLSNLLPQKPRGVRELLVYWFTGERLEIVFTVLTLIAMVLGWVWEKQEGMRNASLVAYTLAYFFGGYFGVIAGFQSLRQFTIDVDLLMVLAALGAAYVGSPFEGAMLLFLFSLSNVLQAYAIDRTRNAIQSLVKLRPQQAHLVTQEGTVTVPIEQIKVGDRVQVRPGDRVPLDGKVIEGESTLDQASVTGESMPVGKSAGDSVFAGTINQLGSLEVEVTRLAEDSTIAKLIRMVEEAQSEKAKMQRFLDKAEQGYAVGVIALTLSLIVIPVFFMGESFDKAFYRAMTVMVVASPCALVISTPASILSAIGNAARKGVLFKGGAHLERTADIQVVAFDKTGTLTEGKPQVTETIAFKGFTAAGWVWSGETSVLHRLVGGVEARSEHPLAQAIVQYVKAQKIQLPVCTAFQAVTGKGAEARVESLRVLVGNLRYMESIGVVIDKQALDSVQRLQDEGKTVVIAAAQGDIAEAPRAIGLIAVADVMRPEAIEVIKDLKQQGIRRVIMITGDNERVAKAIARQAGVDSYYADLMPEDKVRIVKELSVEGPVAMVGDGVNDAPALSSASIGIAMGAAGSDVALESADVVLMANDLKKIPYAIALSRKARTVVLQNLIFACSVIVILIIAALGFHLPLPLGVVGHEGSTVIVCLNGLRLLAFNR